MYPNGSIGFHIEANYATLRSSEKKVADYILKNLEDVIGMSMIELSDKCDVSQPTIMRFVKSLGFDGYKDFQYCLISQGVNNHALYGYHISKDEKIENVPAGICATVITMLEETLKSLSLYDYQKSIDAIMKARNIYIFGVENSHTVCSDLCTKLTYLGLRCCYFGDSYMQRIIAENLNSGDVAIGISYNGSSKDTVDALKAAKKQGAVTICITNFKESCIIQYAHYVLCSSQKQFLYGDAIFSRTTQLAIVDMLYMGLIISDYSRFQKVLDKHSNKIKDRSYV